MQIFILILSLATLTLASLSSHFERKKKKKKFRYSLYALFVVSVITIISQGIRELQLKREDNKSDSIQNGQLKEIKLKSYTIHKFEIKAMSKTDSLLTRQNEMLWKQNQNYKISQELLNFSTGGENNRPVITFDMGNLATNSEKGNGYYIKFCFSNYGKYPIENIKFFIDDQFSAQYEMLADHGKYNIKDVDYSISINPHLAQRFFNYGTINPKSKSCDYEGHVIGGSKEIYYSGNVNWKNGNYSFYCIFNFDEKIKGFRLKEIKYGINGKEINPKQFFPLAPKHFYK